MADIFVSYSRNDRAMVEQLTDSLSADGFSVWWDRNITPGKQFSKELEAELYAAKAVIVVWSPSSLTSMWVADEASVARDAGTLLPIAIDQVEPPLGFRQIQSQNFDGWSGDPSAPAYLQLLEGLKALKQGKPYRQPTARKVPERRQRAAVTLALVLATLLLGMSWFWQSRYANDEQLNSRSTQPAQDNDNVSNNQVDQRGQAVGVAVIPFLNLSSDPEQEHFVDGLSEELLNVLGNVEGLRVPGRTSSFQYKGKAEDMRTIGAQLDVGFLLEGSVRRAGEQLRVTAQLIDAGSGYHVWSKNYDRKFEDVLAIQSEIAQKVVTELLGTVPASAIDGTTLLGEVDPEAHERYLVGRSYWAVRETQSAFDHLWAAVEIDPSHWLAHAYLAIVGVHAQSNGMRLNTRGQTLPETIDKAISMATKLQPNAADVLFAQGWVMEMRQEGGFGVLGHSKAIERLRLAIRANPRHVEALHALSRMQLDQQKRITLLETIVEIDPGHVSAVNNLVRAYLDLGMKDNAKEVISRILTVLPGSARVIAAPAAKAVGAMTQLGEALYGNWAATERSRQTRRLRAAVLADLGAIDAALYLFNREVRGNSISALTDAILVAKIRGDYSRELQLAQQQHEMEPSLVWSANMLARAYLALDQPKAALEVLLQFRPKLLDTDLTPHADYSIGDAELYTAGQVLEALGREAEAQDLWARALKHAEQRAYGEWRHSLNLALLHGRLGNTEEAITHFRKAYDGGFRYLYSFNCVACITDDFIAERGLFEPLVAIPEIAEIIEQIRQENAQTLARFNRDYKILDQVEALIAADDSSSVPTTRRLAEDPQ